MTNNLPTVQRFDAGDYKDAPAWFQQAFLPTLNLFTQSIYNIVNQNIGVMNNTTDELYTLPTITAGASATANTFKFTPKKFVGTPNGVIIGQCIQSGVANPSAIGNPVTLDWVWTGSQISILAIYGLTNGTKYNFTLRIF